MKNVYVVTCSFVDTVSKRHDTMLCCVCDSLEKANKEKVKYEKQRAKEEKEELEMGYSGYYEKYFITEMILR